MSQTNLLNLGNIPNNFIRISFKELFPKNKPSTSEEIINEAEKKLQIRTCTEEEIKIIGENVRLNMNETIYVPFKKSTNPDEQTIMASGKEREGFWEGERHNREISDMHDDLIFVST